VSQHKNLTRLRLFPQFFAFPAKFFLGRYTHEHYPSLPHTLFLEMRYSLAVTPALSLLFTLAKAQTPAYVVFFSQVNCG
jgi:hypothetical protein